MDCGKGYLGKDVGLLKIYETQHKFVTFLTRVRYGTQSRVG